MRERNGSAQPLMQQGFTLVETLVAIVILGVGLLGVAKLVVGAVHANDSGYMRGQATQLAYEMLDLMRANRPGAIAGAYQGAPALADCSTAACSPSVLAGLDLYNWKQRLAQTLPSGNGTVVTAATVGGTVALITVSWDDSQAQWAFGLASSSTPAATTLTLESVL